MFRSLLLSQPPRYLLIHALFILPILVSCGHPATQEECREIMHRTAKLALDDQLSDPQLIETSIKEIEASMEKKMMSQCVGKRITKGVLKCVRSAKTADEISRVCFR